MFVNRAAKLLRKPGRLEPRKRQMRREGPLFPRNANLFHSVFDFCSQEFQIRRGLDPCPEDARVLFVEKKTESTKIECHGLFGAHTGQSASDGAGFCLRHFNDEFQRHVKILRTHPASSQRNRAKGFEQVREALSHRGGNLQRNEQAVVAYFGNLRNQYAVAITANMEARTVISGKSNPRCAVYIIPWAKKTTSHTRNILAARILVPCSCRTDARKVTPSWHCAPAAPRRCRGNGCVPDRGLVARRATGWLRDRPGRPPRVL